MTPIDAMKAVEMCETVIPHLLPTTGDRPKWSVAVDPERSTETLVRIWLVKGDQVKQTAGRIRTPLPSEDNRATAKRLVADLDAVVQAWTNAPWEELRLWKQL